ncbi:hypothetical protein ACFQRB_02770 [Halobaculum litoreum]|uniref:Uncharacterized protein n=1 Tax=Halobaculum litoreum TaxID=3031998 RepID=A0ABD5XKQ4_9EURY
MAVGTLTLSGWGVGLLLATVVVAAAWVAGVRPSIRAGAAFLVVAAGVHLVATPGLSSAGLGAWATVAGRVLAVAVATALCLTPFGGAALGWLRERARTLLRVPPAE